jgi:hypothetical protein
MHGVWSRTVSESHGLHYIRATLGYHGYLQAVYILLVLTTQVTLDEPSSLYHQHM